MTHDFMQQDTEQHVASVKKEGGVLAAEQSALEAHYSFSYEISIHSLIALFSKPQPYPHAPIPSLKEKTQRLIWSLH